ncbi:putative dual specificity protein phosphatase 22 [Trichinella spiralis]|uniref:putative dual specificity protein phosphatase 22 n=1 Tax=Trichinella spiralis TaxID=6334 RepID=UPI0001EFDA9D|nr:putative dual specificity protein phosphatase 22 [Trichinella spiralis]
MAYFMSVTDLGWRDGDLAAERQRMASLFTNAGSLRECDMKKCQQALESYNRWVEFGDRLKDEQESLILFYGIQRQLTVIAHVDQCFSTRGARPPRGAVTALAVRNL